MHKLHDRLHGTREFEDIEWLKDTQAVFDNLTKYCASYLTRRNYLNAVIVLLVNRDEYMPALGRGARPGAGSAGRGHCQSPRRWPPAG